MSAAPPTLPVTVAICTYNRAAWLRQTLDGLMRQDYPAELLEILVIDNNSTDSTAELVAGYRDARHPPRHILETRQGANFARNRAIAEARSEIIVFGDDDILVESDWLRELVRPFASDPAGRIGAVAGEVIPVFPQGCPPWVARFHGPQALRADTGPTPPGPTPMSANLAFRRKTFFELGMFDTTVGRKGGVIFSGDENLVIHRLRRAGYEVWFSCEARAQHQMPAGRTTVRYMLRHAFDSARSRVVGRVNLDRLEGRSSAAYLWSRLPANLAKAVGFALLALFWGILFQRGNALTALVRAWRSCGYLYQIPRSLLGKL